MLDDDRWEVLREWQETSEEIMRIVLSAIFAFVRVLVNFGLGVLYEIMFFLLNTVKDVLVTVLDMFGDRFFKPVLHSWFNSCIHPLCVLIVKTAESLGGALMPLAEAFAKCFSGLKCLQIHYDKDRADIIREV